MALGAEIGLVLLFLLAHAFFSLAETSILNVRKSRLQEMLDDDDTPEPRRRRATELLRFRREPEQFIATVQSGSVFFSFLAATYTTLIASEHLWPLLHETLGVSSEVGLFAAFVVMIVVVTILDLTFGALIPKSVALKRSEAISLAIAPVVRWLVRVLRPVVHLPVVISDLLLRRWHDTTSFSESHISEEELRVMLEEGARTGAIDKTENELIEKIFDFGERTARQIMVPRISMAAIDLATPREQVIERIITEGYTRLPVYRDSIEEIIGMINSKDVLALIEHPDLIILFDIIRPVAFVPETKLLSELLRDFQHQKLHMAVVVDEFGGTAGLVTLEDILEEIVGEIHDEFDEEERRLLLRPEEHAVILSANYSIGDANAVLEQHFPDYHIPVREDYELLSGYVNSLFLHIPDVGEYRETRGVRVTVTAKDRMNVSEVRFEPASGDPEHQTTSDE